MNIEYLKYFAELAKLQHYGKAAKALNISQPGLSHAIKTLEDEYGVPLFQKEGRNVSLSRYGKELMQDVEEILDAYLRMEERAAGLRTEEKTVRIGTVYPLAAGTIPHPWRPAPSDTCRVHRDRNTWSPGVRVPCPQTLAPPD